MIDALDGLLCEPSIVSRIMPGRLIVTKYELPPGTLFFGDDLGGGLFFELPDGVYEGHYIFMPCIRGAELLRRARNAISRLFTTTQAHDIMGAVPRGYSAARVMTRALGFSPIGEKVDGAGRPCVVYRMERRVWGLSQKICSGPPGAI